MTFARYLAGALDGTGLAEAILADPATWRPLSAQAAGHGLSARTLTRRFPAETGFTFRAWQQRTRLAKAME